MMTKDEIIGGIVATFRAEAKQEGLRSEDDLDYELVICDTLIAKLAPIRPDELVRTCDDFGHLGIQCCDSCHTCYPHYELDLIGLESGGQAWICCALDRALNPQRHRKLPGAADDSEIEKWLGGAVETANLRGNR